MSRDNPITVCNHGAVENAGTASERLFEAKTKW